MIKKILWFIVIAVVAVAIIRVFPWNDPSQVWAALGDASDKFGAWVQEFFDNGIKIDEIQPPDTGIMPTTQGDIPTDIQPE